MERHENRAGLLGERDAVADVRGLGCPVDTRAAERACVGSMLDDVNNMRESRESLFTRGEWLE